MPDKVFIGRQPIYNSNLDVESYELLFRSGTDNRANFADGDQATCQVLINTLVEIGLDNLLGDRVGFVNLTRGFLTGEIPLPFDKQRFVIEVLEDIEVNDELIAAVQELSSQGFTIALDDVVYEPKLQPLLEIVDIVKVDYRAVDRNRVAEQVKTLREYSLKLLAEKIETFNEFEYCRDLGFDLFQGYFLARPQIICKNRLTNNKAALLQLLAKFQDPEIGMGELEELICQDVSLSYKLLRFTNSSTVGIRHKVDSIHQALILMGLESIRTIVTLILMSSAEDKPIALLHNAMLRAKMCELLGQQFDRHDRDSFFTVGLFSSLDAIMDVSMEEILKELPLSHSINVALLGNEGAMGAALRCALAHEQGNWNSTSCLTLKPSQIQEAYLRAVQWVETDPHMSGLMRGCRKPQSASAACV